MAGHATLFEKRDVDKMEIVKFCSKRRVEILPNPNAFIFSSLDTALVLRP